MASATPEEELRDILERRGLTRYFKGVFGYPTPKAEALRFVQGAEGIQRNELLFIGDAQADCEAAEQVGCRFVGRRPADGSNPFAGKPVDVVPNCVPLISWLAGSQAART